jgi:hypothetical protein
MLYLEFSTPFWVRNTFCKPYFISKTNLLTFKSKFVRNISLDEEELEEQLNQEFTQRSM